MSIVNKLKAIADIITPPAGYKTLFFRSDTGVPAVKDENGVVSDLVIPGDASGVTFTPMDSLDWTDSVDPGNVDDALNDLARRMVAVEADGGGAGDAAELTYTPTTAADWDGDVDPGDAQEAFDQLAERVTDIEETYPSASFATIAVSGQSNVVADSGSDTLTIAAGTNVSITTDAGSDTITINAPVDASGVTFTPGTSINWTDSEDPGNVDDALDDLAARVQSLEENPVGGGGSAFSTIAVSGQSNVVADAAPDTLTLVAGSGITITTDAGADSVTIAAASGGATLTQFIAIAASDETTALTTGTAKATFRMPYGFTLTSVKATVTTAPTGATLNVDINKTGVGSILSTVITIDASEKTSATAATPPVISTSALSADDELTIDIDQVGSTIAGAGLKVYLIGTISGSVSVDASTTTYTPSHSINWTDSEDPGNVDTALDDLAARVQGIEEIVSPPPAMVLVASATVSGEAVTSIDFTNLNLDTHGTYFVRFGLKNATASTNIVRMFYNADTTTTNYYRQSFASSSTTNAANRMNTAQFITIAASAHCSGFGYVYKPAASDVVRATSMYNSDGASAVEGSLNWHAWTSANNPTQITFTSDQASGLDIGSFIEIYAVSTASP